MTDALCVGLKRAIDQYARYLGIPSNDALPLLFETSPALGELISTYRENRSTYKARVRQDFGEAVPQLVELSQESHFHGNHVVRTCSEVVYSQGRCNSNLFLDVSDFYTKALGVDSLGRRYLGATSQFFRREYVVADTINDVKLASSNAGFCLALAWVISATDLHFDNIVWRGNVPIVIDDECTGHPLRYSQISALGGERQHYPFSPFRTILIQEVKMGRRKAVSGFESLLSIGADIHALLESFSEGANFLFKNIDEIISIFEDKASRGQDIRYLVRGTEFYDTCIYSIAGDFIQEKIDRDRVLGLFKNDLSLFPETEFFVEAEVRSLLRCETPYFRLRLKDGVVIDPASNSELGMLTPPIKWIKDHLISIRAASLESYVHLLRNELEYSSWMAGKTS